MLHTLENFRFHLKKTGLSPVSAKNYTSDIRKYLLWCSSSALDYKNTASFSQYQLHLIESRTPASSIARTISSLKKFGDFLTRTNQTNANPGSVFEKESTVSSSRSDYGQYLKDFENHLGKENLAEATAKNYISDIHQYIDWISGQFLTPKDNQGSTIYNLRSIPCPHKAGNPDQKACEGCQLEHFLDQDTAKQFITHLENTTPQTHSSILRKIASINRLRDWAEVSGRLKLNRVKNFTLTRWLKSTPTDTAGLVSRLPSFLKNPLTKLENTKAYQNYHGHPLTPYLHLAILLLFTTAIGVFGYKQFAGPTLSIIEAYPSTLNRPTRQLSFQGRLTDSSGTPITTAVNVVFKLFNDATVGSELYTTGTCSVDPDQDGVFNSILGNDCGSEIASSVFTENTGVWMQIQVASETLTPRQRIATVAYAINSETVQGFPADETANASTIPVINASGDMVIAEASPSIQSTSGTFLIEGQAITIATANTSNGNIAINPDGTGTLNLTFEGTDPGSATNYYLNATNANQTTGSLIGGYIGNDTGTANLLSLSSGSTQTERFTVAATGQTTISAPTKGKATLIVNQLDSGPIFSASSSGTTRITLANNGDLSLATGVLNLPNSNTLTGVSNYLQASAGLSVGGGTTYYINSSGTANLNALTTAGTLTANGDIDLGNAITDTITFTGRVDSNLEPLTNNTYNLGSNTQRWANVYGTTLYQAGNQVCDTSGNCSVGAGQWSQANGAIFPTNNTLDLLVGGSATTSAKFAFTGVNSGTPTASISGNLSLQAPTGASPATKLNILNGGTFGIRTGGGGDASLTERLTILNNGRVGIGTTTPAGILHLQGSQPSIIFTDTSQANQTWQAGAADGYFSILGQDNARHITAHYSTGNIGMGTTSPDHKLEISGGYAGNALVTLNDTNGNDILTASASGTTRFVIQSDGDVGIGVNNPLATLDIADSSAGIRLTSTGTNAVSVQLQNGDPTVYAIGKDSNDRLFINRGTYPGQYSDFVLSNIGNIGLGTTSPASKLHITGSYGANALLTLNETSATNDIFTASSSGTTRFVIQNNGDVGIGTNNPGYPLEVNGQIYANGSIITSGTLFASTIRDTSGGNVTIQDDGGNVGIGVALPLSTLHINGTYAGNALVRFNETGSNDIFTASASGITKLSLSNSGQLRLFDSDASNYTGFVAPAALTGNPVYTLPGADGSSGYVLATNGSGTLSWTDTSALGASIWNHADHYTYLDDYWQDDLVIGGNSTASADTQLFANGGAVFNEQSNDADFRIESNGNANMFFVDASTDRIGIGTNSPSYDLDIAATGSINQPSVAIRGTRYSTIFGNQGIYTEDNAGTDTGYIGSSGADPFELRTNSTSRLRVTPTGEIGIGTTSPASKLHVSGGYAGNALVTLNDTNGNDLFTASASGTTRLRVENDGSVYIRSGSGGVDDEALEITYPGGGGLANTKFSALANLQTEIGQDWTALYAKQGAATYAGVFNGQTIVLNDNFGIGTTAPVSRLHVTGNYAGKALATLNETGGQDIFTASASGTPRFLIQNDGDIFVGSVTNTGSDDRVTINKSTSASLNSTGINLTLSDTTADAFISTGILSLNELTAAGTQSNSLIGINAIARNAGAGNITSEAQALNIDIQLTSTGNITTGKGIQIDTFLDSGAGAITNAYGLYVADQTTASTGNYSIYTNAGDVVLDAGNYHSSNVSIGTATPVGKLQISGGYAGNALVALNNTNSTDILTASASGITKLSLSNSGQLRLFDSDASNYTGFVAPAALTGNPVYTLPSADAGGSGYALTSNGSGTLSWSSVATDSNIYWGQANGAIFPKNNSVDLLVGSTASSSAKFAVLNVNSGTPTASVSAGTTGAAYLTAAGELQTTANQSLSLGGTTTGNIILNGDGNGAVGIGTSTPLANMHLRGTAATLMIDTQAAGENSYLALAEANSTKWQILNRGASLDKFQIAGDGGIGVDLFFTLDQTGNLGLGTESPASKLHVSGSYAGNALVTLNETSATNDIFTASSSGTTKFVIQNDGDVGLANNTNLMWKNGAGTSDVNVLSMDANNSVTLSAGPFATGQGALTLQGHNNTALQTDVGAINIKHTGSNALYYIALHTANTERMRIDNSGNIGIGTTSPTALLDIAGSASTSGTLSFRGTTDPKINVLNGENLSIFTSPGGDAGLAERITVLNNGKVGIGSTNPLFRLTVGLTDGETQAIQITDSGAANGSLSFSDGTNNAGLFEPTIKGNIDSSVRSFKLVGNAPSGQDSGTAPITLFRSTVNDGNVATRPLFQWFNNATATMTMDASGNLGLGTTSPASKLHVSGGYAGNSLVALNQTNTTGDIFTASSSGTPKFSIQNDGDIAIGSTSITPKQVSVIDASGGSEASVAVGESNSLYGFLEWDATSDILNLQTVSHGSDIQIGNNWLYADSATGNIGIGDTSADAKLNILSTTEQLRLDYNDSNYSSFTVAADGELTIAGTGTDADITLNPGGSLIFSDLNCSGNANGGALTADASGVVTCTDDDAGASGTNYWRVGTGAISPYNDTLDLLVGSDSSASAKFAVLNVNSGTPTASVSAGTTGAAYLTAAGNLQTTANQSLVLGGSTTGAITLSENTIITGTLDVQGAISDSNSDLSLNDNVGIAGTLTLSSLGAGSTNTVLVHNSGIVQSRTIDSRVWGSTLVDGSGSAGHLSYWSDADTLTYDSNANFYIDSTNNLLGLGTITPTSKFHITGSYGANALVTLNETSSTNNILTASSSGTTRMVLANNGNLTLSTGDLFVDGGQIGLTADTDLLSLASGALTVNGSITTTSTITLPNSNTATGVTNFLRLSQGLSVGGADTFYFNSTGDINSNSVSIGGTSVLTSGRVLQNITQATIDNISINGNTISSTTGDIVLTPTSNLVFTGFNCTGNTNGGVLTANASGIISCGDDDSGTSVPLLWRAVAGAISPINDTYDLLLGGVSTASAKFAFLNVGSGTPTASISGSLALAVPTGAAPASTLDILNSGSLNIRTSPGGVAGATSRFFVGANGNIGIGTDNPTSKLQIAGSSSTISNTSGDITLNAASDQIAFSGDDLVNIGDIDLAGQLSLGSYGANPTAISNGSLIYRSDTNSLTYYNGSSWVGLSDKLWTNTLNVFHPSDAYAGVVDIVVGGTSTASAKVALNATTGYITGQRFSDTSSSNYFIDPAATDISMAIYSKAGIGTTAPAHQLHVTSSITGKALVALNETGANDIFTASQGGTTKFNIDGKGSTTIGASTAYDASVRVYGDLLQPADTKITTSLTNIQNTFIYDTSQDSDGGRWRTSTISKGLSWYTESKDDNIITACNPSTHDRCGTSEFPIKAYIVATTDSVYIYDMHKNTLWMKFTQGSSNAIGADSNSVPTAVTAKDGVIYIGTNGTASDTGLYAFDFTNDTMYYTDTTDRSEATAGISTRNAGSVSYSLENHTAYALTNTKINDLDIGYLDGKKYLAAATDGGINTTDLSSEAIKYEYVTVTSKANSTDTITDDGSANAGSEAFDFTTTTFARSDVADSVFIVTYQFATAKTIYRYIIQNDDAVIATESPEDWTFQGSNNGTDWTTLDTQAAVSWTDTGTDSDKKIYPISSPGSYTYYRINISDAVNAVADQVILYGMEYQERRQISKVRVYSDNIIQNFHAKASSVSTSTTYSTRRIQDWRRVNASGESLAAGQDTTPYFQLNLTEAAIATQYSFSFSSVTTTAPVDIALKGSQDGKNWTTLDTQSSLTFSTYQYKAYSFSNSTAYKFYRLHVTTGDSGTTMEIGDFSINSPIITASSSNNDTTQDETNLIYQDNSSSTYYWISALGTGANEWVRYDYGSTNRLALNSYGVRGYQVTQPTRAINDWRIQACDTNGSQDCSSAGAGWVTLDTQTDQSFASDYDLNTYTFTNSTAYRYYRLYVDQANGGTYATLMNLHFYGAEDRVVASSDESNAADNVNRIHDEGDFGTWSSVSGETTAWIEKHFAEGQEMVVTGFNIVGAGGTTESVRDWTFKGSNDRSTWTDLATRDGVGMNSTTESQTYTFANNTAYQFYRLQVDANNGSATTTSITELKLIGGRYHNVKFSGNNLVGTNDATGNLDIFYNVNADTLSRTLQDLGDITAGTDVALSANPTYVVSVEGSLKPYLSGNVVDEKMALAVDNNQIFFGSKNGLDTIVAGQGLDDTIDALGKITNSVGGTRNIANKYNLDNYWPMELVDGDQGLTDYGSGNVQSEPFNVTTKGTAPTASASGKIGRALRFQKTQSQVAIIPDTRHSDLDAGGNGFSVGAWIKPTSLNQGTNTQIMGDFLLSTNHYGWYIQSAPTTGLRFCRGDGSAATTTCRQTTYVLPSDNNWYHMVITSDATNLYFYVNSQLIHTDTVLTVNDGGDLYIGCGGLSACTVPFDGNIDEAFVAYRNLTADQVRGIYSEGTHQINTLSPEGSSPRSVTNTDATTYSSTTIGDSALNLIPSEFTGHVVEITGGTGSGQTRLIVKNSATTLTVSPAWSTTPDTTSDFEITPYALPGSITNAEVVDVDQKNIYLGLNNDADAGGVVVIDRATSAVIDYYHGSAGKTDDESTSWNTTAGYDDIQGVNVTQDNLWIASDNLTWREYVGQTIFEAIEKLKQIVGRVVIADSNSNQQSGSERTPVRQVIRKGWGFIDSDDADKAVYYGISYDRQPTVLTNYAGNNATAEEVTSLSQCGNYTAGNVVVASDIKTNRFSAVDSVTGTACFTWLSIGDYSGQTYNGSFAGGADLAEWYGTDDESLQAGEVVAIDPSGDIKVIRSSTPYDQSAIGIIATKPSVTLGPDSGLTPGYSTDPQLTNRSKTAVQVALAGRVPVKVSLENGPILPGDPLTTSTIPGLAAKAVKPGPIIGKAMEAFDGTSTIVGMAEFGTTADLESFKSNLESGVQPEASGSAGIKIQDPTLQELSAGIGTIMAFVNTSWYDPSYKSGTDEVVSKEGVYALDSSGRLVSLGGWANLPEPSSISKVNQDYSFLQNELTNKTELQASAGATSSAQIVINRLESLGSLATGSLKAATANIYGLLNVNQIKSGQIETKELATDLITPIASGSGDLVIDLRNPGSMIQNLGSVNDSQFGTLIVKGNASISGELVANSARLNEVTAASAQIERLKAAKGYFEELQVASLSADVITGLDEQIDARLQKLQDQIAAASNGTIEQSNNSSSDLIATASNSDDTIVSADSNEPDLTLPSSDLDPASTIQDLGSSYYASSSSDLSAVALAEVDGLYVRDFLAVGGLASIVKAEITDYLTIGGTLLADGNSLSTTCPNSTKDLQSTSCSNTLFLQPLGGSLNLLAGLMTLDQQGGVVVNGDFTVNGQFTALRSKIQDLESTNATISGSLALQGQPGFGNLFTVTDETGNLTATINASGSARFNGVAAASADFNSVRTSQLIIASDTQAVASSSGFLGSTVETNATTGTATLTAGKLDITILNKNVTTTDLVYITPTTSTDNKVLYVSSKRADNPGTPESDASFTVSIDTPINQDIKFNWWIIKTE